MSNSIGNLKNSGLQGNNFPWQLKMLVGQQCACDQLKLANDILQEIDNNTDQVEPLLLQILTAIQNGSDFEAFLVVDNAGVNWLEVRIWNPATGTFDPPVYFLAGSNTPGTPAAPISYINPNSYLAQIVSYTSNLVSIEAGTPNALGQTTMANSMPVVIASNQTAVPASQSGTWNLNNITGTVSLPTGAATEVTLAAVNTKLTPATRTHNTVSATGAGTVPAGSLRGSVMNVGSAAGVWNGISIPAGVAIPWDAVGPRDTYGSIAYDATGTTLIIEYTT